MTSYFTTMGPNPSYGAGDPSRVWAKVTHQRASRILRRGVYWKWHTRGSTKPGAESDVYDDLVFSHRSTSFVNAQCRITTGEFTQIKPQLRRSPAETAEPIEMLLDVWTRVGWPTGIGSGSSVSVCGYRSSYIENSWPVVWKFVKICEFYEFLELIEFAFSVYVGAVRRVYTGRDDGHRGRVNRCKTAERIEMLLEVWTRVDPRKRV